MAVDIGSILARLYLDRTAFTESLAAAVAEAKAFPDVNVGVSANTSRFDASMVAAEAAKAKVAQPVSTPVTMASGAFQAGAAAVEAEKAALSTPVVIPVELDTDKLSLFSRLVGAGQPAQDVAAFLGFNRAELGQAMASIAAAAAEDQRGALAQAGEEAAASMVAGWLGESQKALGPGGEIIGLYRRFALEVESMWAAIPMGPSQPNFTWIRGALPSAERLALPAGPSPMEYGQYRIAGDVIDATTHDLEEGESDGGVTAAIKGFAGSVVGRLTAAFGAASGGGGGGLLSKLLWGGGSGGIPTGFGALGAGMAGLGSIGALAGLGPEHLLMTLIGLGGSAASGLAGGGLLALGGLGTLGVGMGTDMAGIGQAAGDIQQYSTLTGNLAQAAAVYGKSSTEYQAAMYAYQQWAQDLSKTTIQALSIASNTASQFHALFDKATGEAETTGAQILTEAMKVGEAYLPTIGKFAAQNMDTIKKDIQPLFSWLSGVGGLSIFTNLEQDFQRDLPTGISILTNGLELFAKTVDIAANEAGQFLPKLDAFLEKWNSAAGTNAWGVEIDKLIGDFRMWEALIKAAGQDIYYLFKNDAGTGATIVTTLTEMLQKLGDWEKSTTGADELHNLFTTHLQEVKALLSVLPPLVHTLGLLELSLAPGLTTAFTVVLRDAVDPFLEAMAKDPVGSWVLGLTLLSGKLFGFKTLFQGIAGIFTGSLFSSIGGALSVLRGGISGLVNGFEKLLTLIPGVDAAMVGFDAEADANPLGALILALAALGIGLYELIDHFRTVQQFLSGPWGTAISASVAVMAPFIGLPMLIIGHWQGVENFFVGAWHGIDTAFHGIELGAQGVAVGFVDAYDTVEPIVMDIVHVVQTMAAGVESALHSIDAGGVVDAVTGGLATAAKSAGHGGSSIFGDITSALGPALSTVALGPLSLLPDLFDSSGRSASTAASSVDDFRQAASQLAGAIRDDNSALTTDNNAVQNAIDLTSTLVGKQLSAVSASDGFYSAVESLTQSLATNGHSLSVNTQAGLSNRQAFDQVGSAIQQVISTMEQQGATSSQIVGKVSDLTSYIITQAGKYGLTSGAVKAYLQQLGLTPAQVSTEIKLYGQAQATAALQALKNQIDNLPSGKTISVSVLEQVANSPLTGGHISGNNAKNLMGSASGSTIGPGQRGFKTHSAAIVGEDGSGYDEYVVPTNPAHRANALALWAGLTSDLGLMAGGGVLGNQPTVNKALNVDMSASGSVGSLSGWLSLVLGQMGAQAQQQMQQSLAGLGTGGGYGSGGSIEQLAMAMAAARGWTGAQFAALAQVEMDEAGWNMNAVNPTSGAYGLAQGITGPSWYYGYGGNPNTPQGQLTAMFNYIAGRYGSPMGALAHENAYHWYAGGGLLGKEATIPLLFRDTGGPVPPGLSMVANGTGDDEYIMPPDLVTALQQLTGQQQILASVTNLDSASFSSASGASQALVLAVQGLASAASTAQQSVLALGNTLTSSLASTLQSTLAGVSTATTTTGGVANTTTTAGTSTTDTTSTTDPRNVVGALQTAIQNAGMISADDLAGNAQGPLALTQAINTALAQINGPGSGVDGTIQAALANIAAESQGTFTGTPSGNTLASQQALYASTLLQQALQQYETANPLPSPGYPAAAGTPAPISVNTTINVTGGQTAAETAAAIQAAQISVVNQIQTVLQRVSNT